MQHASSFFFTFAVITDVDALGVSELEFRHFNFFASVLAVPIFFFFPFSLLLLPAPFADCPSFFLFEASTVCLRKRPHDGRVGHLAHRRIGRLCHSAAAAMAVAAMAKLWRHRGHHGRQGEGESGG